MLAEIRFDPTDPHRVVTVSTYGKTPELWRWGSGSSPERILTYEPPPLSASDYLSALAISPNGLLVAGMDTRGTVHLWDARTGALRPDSYPLGSTWPSYAVAFDPSNQLIAATVPDGIRIWRLSAAEPPMMLRHPNAIDVTFDPFGQHLVSIASDGTIRIWTREGKLERELRTHDVPLSVSFSKNGDLFALGTAEGLVEVWDTRSGILLMRERHHSASVNRVVFLPSDRFHLISASDDSTVARFTCRACTDPEGMIRDAREWVKANPAYSQMP
jgi:WD40 repeat protein